jgi:hypothetical protein
MELPVVVILYEWNGTPADGKKSRIGVATLNEKGHAVWEDSIDRIVGRITEDREGRPVTPRRGEEFLRAVAARIQSPPYMWAELKES